ncbi:PEP-utilizing enzyme [Streptomyces sp. NPDC088124]|uniref:PEP-utilizing enzyme n=1 Tax=Streptomyces sp. NPDC088124 TaxID=3154654 RepID=UPI00341E11D6
MSAELAVVWPRPLLGPGMSDPVRLRDVLAHVLDRPAASVELTVAPATTREVLARQQLAAAMWLPGGAVPSEALRRALLGRHGVGVWTGQLTVPARAYSFGPLALRAHSRCVESGCAPAGSSAAATARHLVARHRVPLAGPRPGLVPWQVGEQRARLLLGGKDVSLRRLAPLLAGVRVDEGLSVGWRWWERDPGGVLDEVAVRYAGRGVIVRSCSDGEDGWERSGAGAYLSVPVAVAAPPGVLAEAVRAVFASYGAQGPDVRVFVQEWLHPVQAAGVVTARSVAGAPYYTAAVDLVSGRTDTVTAGTGKGVQTWYVRRPCGVELGQAGMPSAARQLLDAAVETEQCVGTSCLDVEVALSGGAVHLLQARPLAAARAVADARVHRVVDMAKLQIGGLAGRTGRFPGTGAGVVLSTMADWNPAEMLGRRPSALAASLYAALITERTWAQQRAAYGYRDLRGTPLMHVVAGSTYIDALVSLASFVPAGIDEALAAAVLRAMGERLVADPLAHDKIEFEIAATCWTPRIAERTAYLASAGIGSAARRRLHEQLLTVTRGGVRRLADDVRWLERASAPTRADAGPERLAATLNAAQGAALRFAHLARAGFVATDLLRVLEAEGLADRREEWVRTVGTPATALRRDASEVTAGRLVWEAFVERYRWIRPGTYDLAVPAYGDDPEGYLRPLLDIPPPRPHTVTAPWSARNAAAVTVAVAPLGLDAAELEAFCRAAITGREHGKAFYAGWVSAVLEGVRARGRAGGLADGDVRYLRVGEVLGSEAGRWPGLVARRRAHAEVCALVELPDVITGPDNLDCFVRAPGRANFVTGRQVSGPVHADPAPASPPPPGAVIVLEAADPGYDWVFAHGPGALVTAYGGANSHMMIRCAELGVPAAIGIGPQAHALVAAARSVAVDAAAGRVDVLS